MVESTDPRDLAEGVDGPAEAFVIGITGVVIAIFSGFIAIAGSLVDGLTDIISVMEAVRDFFIAIFIEPVGILEAGSAATQAALTDFGLEGFVLSIVVIASGWMVWNFLDPELPLIDDLLPWR